MSTTPRRGKFSQGTTVTWSSGANFNGFILVGLVPPTSGGSDIPNLAVGAGQATPTRVPTFAFVKVTNGLFDSNASLFFNADLEPPNSQYVCWFYDLSRTSNNQDFRQVAGPSTKFTVSTDPFTPPSLTLTVPSTGTTNPTPD